jgi:hypothetical protein
MSLKSPNEPMLVVGPVSLPLPQEMAVELPTVFPPSVELGEQLRHLEKAQVEINRRKAEELARLREIQNRD